MRLFAFTALTLFVISAVYADNKEIVQPITDEEIHQIDMWVEYGVITKQNLPDYLKALKEEAHHPDRLRRALNKIEKRPLMSYLSGPSLGENPVEILSAIVLTIAFVVFITLHKPWVMPVCDTCGL